MPKKPAVEMPNFVGGNRLLTFREMEQLLHVHERTLYKWVADKAIPSYKVGRNRKFKFDEIMWWLEGKKTS